MYDKTLPVGSVVLLHGGAKKVMVLGYCKRKQGEMTKIYDYAGCVYPEGFLSQDTTVLFDHSQVKRIYALGYQDEEQIQFEQRLLQALEKLNDEE